jgi:Ca2+-binding RTX toxin-like protein
VSRARNINSGVVSVCIFEPRRLAGTLPKRGFALDSGDDLLILGPGDDGSTGDHFRVAEGEVSGDGGNDTIDGGQAADFIVGGSGANQEVSGEGGDDKIAGGEGNDAEIIGDHRAANPSGASGDDTLFGDAGNDGLHGDSFADGIDSGNGEDTCDGGPHTDTAANCEKQISIP